MAIPLYPDYDDKTFLGTVCWIVGSILMVLICFFTQIMQTDFLYSGNSSISCTILYSVYWIAFLVRSRGYRTRIKYLCWVSGIASVATLLGLLTDYCLYTHYYSFIGLNTLISPLMYLWSIPLAGITRWLPNPWSTVLLCSKPCVYFAVCLIFRHQLKVNRQWDK